MVYVTHDQTEAMTMASRIVVLNGGRVEQVGPPLELYNRPANRFVAGFLGSPRMNFVKGTAYGPTIGIRPEAFSDQPCPGLHLKGRVSVVEQLGRETLIYLDAQICAFDSESAEGHFAIHRSRQIDARPGQILEFWAPPAAFHVFDSDDRAIRAPSSHA